MKEKNKKITMWWNLPPEELDEVIEANDGKLNPFMHIEEDEKDHNRSQPCISGPADDDWPGIKDHEQQLGEVWPPNKN